MGLALDIGVPAVWVVVVAPVRPVHCTQSTPAPPFRAIAWARPAGLGSTFGLAPLAPARPPPPYRLASGALSPSGARARTRPAGLGSTFGLAPLAHATSRSVSSAALAGGRTRRSARARSGNRRIHSSTTTSVPTPPITTEGTVPNHAAVT